MQRTVCIAFAALFAAIFLAGCGGGGATTFDIAFEAPGGTGLVGGQVGGLRYAPHVSQDLILARAVSVLGRVTDSTGAPLTDADVDFAISATAPPFDSDNTDGGGNYAVSLAPGTWHALVNSGSQALGRMEVSGLAVASPGPVTFNFQFPAPVAVTGAVRDSLGAGIAGARLTFTGRDSGARVNSIADGSGLYSAALVPDTYEAVVTPVGPAAATHMKQRFANIVVSASLARDFLLTRGVQVSGTVFTNLGVPFAAETSVRVLLPDNSVFFAPSNVSTSDVDGTYSIGPVPTGGVTFQLRPPDASGFPLQRFPRQVDGPTVETENFTLATGYVLSGTIVRDDGTTPESDVTVEAFPRDGSPAPEDVKTNGAGFYSISLFPGTYDIKLTPKVSNRQLPEIRAVNMNGPITLNIVLQRGAIVSGTVLEPDGITPAQDIRVEIAGVLGASDVTDGDGLYSFLAPPGTQTLQLTAVDGPFEDRALADEGVFVTLPGPVTANVTLVLALTGRTVVEGTVFAPDGIAPVAGSEIAAFDATGSRIARTLSAADGTYILVIR